MSARSCASGQTNAATFEKPSSLSKRSEFADEDHELDWTMMRSTTLRFAMTTAAEADCLGGRARSETVADLRRPSRDRQRPAFASHRSRKISRNFHPRTDFDDDRGIPAHGFLSSRLALCGPFLSRGDKAPLFGGRRSRKARAA